MTINHSTDNEHTHQDDVTTWVGRRNLLWRVTLAENAAIRVYPLANKKSAWLWPETRQSESVQWLTWEQSEDEGAMTRCEGGVLSRCAISVEGRWPIILNETHNKERTTSTHSFAWRGFITCKLTIILLRPNVPWGTENIEVDKAKLTTAVFDAIFNWLWILWSFYYLNQTQWKACESHAQ